MTKTVQSYVETLSGWQAALAVEIRALFEGAGGFEEQFKWGHPVYAAHGPVAMFKAHKAHVTLGFWRGADMVALDDRLEPSGGFRMAFIKLTEKDALDTDRVGALITRGAALNAELGDPTKSA